jgi:hypothetical protein
VTKTIGDNYKIYSLIIILNTRIVASVRCELFKMSNVSHLPMLLPTCRIRNAPSIKTFVSNIEKFI